MKTKITTYGGSVNTNFQSKSKSTMQVFISNNARFCYQIKKKKVLSSNTFRKMQI